jgi:hypothetical protein
LKGLLFAESLSYCHIQTPTVIFGSMLSDAGKSIFDLGELINFINHASEDTANLEAKEMQNIKVK